MGVSAHRRSRDDTTNGAPRALAHLRGLAFLGIDVDEERNRMHATVVSPANGPVAVRVIPTNEELMIARSVVPVLSVS